MAKAVTGMPKLKFFAADTHVYQPGIGLYGFESFYLAAGEQQNLD